jgi:signal recognition particle subunit SEC65
MAPLDVEVIPFVSDGQSDAALDQSLSQEQALTVAEEKAVEEPEVREVEAEWRSLGLDVEVKEEVVDVEVEQEVEDSEVSEVEEEWPSLGLDIDVQEEAVDADFEKEKEVEDSVLSEGEEEWPSIKSIPGLELSQSQLSSEISKSKKSQTSSDIDYTSESSSLGELRFQDD